MYVCVCVFEQAKSKCGQVTLLRAASMAEQATACGQLANVNVTYSGARSLNDAEGHLYSSE